MLSLLAATVAASGGSIYLGAAGQAASWIRSELKRAGHSLELYSGTAGVALFFVEAYYSTGDRSYLVDAEKIGDDILAGISQTTESERVGEWDNRRLGRSRITGSHSPIHPFTDQPTQLSDTGLYTGVAGFGFTLNEIAKASHEKKFADGAQACLNLVVKRAKSVGNGVEWAEGNDIISGSAGIGCFLLYAAKEMHSAGALDLARKAGDRLIEIAIPDSGGLKWKMAADYDRLMPNFSHGTAGIAFFLARLYEESKDVRYLEAAKAGAAYLMKQTNVEGLIWHDDQNGPGLCYLGWCHGPVGTSRLFGVLHRITGDPQYGEWIDHAAASVMKSGIPEKQTPGFWNNVGLCCGSAGVAEFFLDIYQFDRQPSQIAFAKLLTDDLLKRASKEGAGLKWIQAENRIQPDKVEAQIGLMQGAAGIGLWLLHLDYQERGLRQKIYLPDNPFRGRH